jgi:predicted protein tyrosine phosphatase
VTKLFETHRSKEFSKASKASILIAPYQHVGEALANHDVTHVVSILGAADPLTWPSVGNRSVVRLKFDDASYSNGELVAPNQRHIADLIYFARHWNCAGIILVHCRAGTSRSPAAAMIAAAAVGRMDVAQQILDGKAYFRPHHGMLGLADAQLEPALRLAKLTRSPSPPDQTEAIEVSSYSLA